MRAHAESESSTASGRCGGEEVVRYSSALEGEDREELVKAEARQERREAVGAGREAEASEETAEEAVEREERGDGGEEARQDAVGAREKAGDAGVGGRGDGREEVGERREVAEVGDLSQALDRGEGGEELGNEAVELVGGREAAEEARQDVGLAAGREEVRDGARAREEAEDDLEQLLDDLLEAGGELGEVVEGRGDGRQVVGRLRCGEKAESASGSSRADEEREGEKTHEDRLELGEEVVEAAEGQAVESGGGGDVEERVAEEGLEGVGAGEARRCNGREEAREGQPTARAARWRRGGTGTH